MKTHIVYIPGLGDGYGWFRSLALAPWRLWGVTTTHVKVNWYDGGSMESKLAGIRRAIDAVPAGRRVVLIGESAGATLALHTADRDSRVRRVITLCGVARPSTPVSGYLRRKAPALSHGVDSLSDTYTTDVHSVRAVVDGVVGKRYSVVAGATEHVVWSVGHVSTIVLCLTVLSPFMAHLAKAKS